MSEETKIDEVVVEEVKSEEVVEAVVIRVPNDSEHDAYVV